MPSTKKEHFRVKRKTFWLSDYFCYLLHSFSIPGIHVRIYWPKWSQILSLFKTVKNTPQLILCALLSHFERQATALPGDYHSGLSLGLSTKLQKREHVGYTLRREQSSITACFGEESQGLVKHFCLCACHFIPLRGLFCLVPQLLLHQPVLCSAGCLQCTEQPTGPAAFPTTAI